MGADFVKKAPFIVIEGLDGSGKSTQLRLLSDWATRAGLAHVVTREPGGAALSEELRELFKSPLGMKASALTQFLMMWASRRNYLEEIVWPALDLGTPVFSDRGDASTMAYQVYAKNAPELEAGFWHLRRAVFERRVPDVYIFLDMPPEDARRRAIGDAKREEISHFDLKPVAFYEKVHAGYRHFAEHPSVSMITIDGTRNQEEIHRDVYAVVAPLCGWQ